MAKAAKQAKAKKKTNPFGTAQTKMFLYILKHPGCTKVEIKEGCFNDKQDKYVSNLLKENENYISIETFDNADMPSKYKIKADKLAAIVDLKHYVDHGELVAV